MATDPERATDGSDTESGEYGLFEEEDAEQKLVIYGDPDRIKRVLKQMNMDVPEYLQVQYAAQPEAVKRRVRALKRLQLKTTLLEADFYKEVHALECKYYQLSSQVYAERSQIVSGLVEPKDEDCVWENDEDDEGLTNDLKTKVKIEVKDDEEVKKEKDEENIKGIPNFWLTIFKNVKMTSDMVQLHDEPILSHLYDIQIFFLKEDPMGFVLEFHFSPNEYFSNSVLTKQYFMKCEPEKDDPFNFEGPEIYKCKGCTIDWKKGKNVTVKTIKKCQKHKSRGTTRVLTKTVSNDSFFNFFTSPVVADDSEAEMDEETQALLTTDFEIGHYIRERIVPRAVLYFTGEGLEDDDFDDDDEDDEDDEDEDEDGDEDEEEDGSQPIVAGGGKSAGIDPAQCKQQ